MESINNVNFTDFHMRNYQNIYSSYTFSHSLFLPRITDSISSIYILYDVLSLAHPFFNLFDDCLLLLLFTFTYLSFNLSAKQFCSSALLRIYLFYSFTVSIWLQLFFLFLLTIQFCLFIYCLCCCSYSICSL